MEWGEGGRGGSVLPLKAEVYQGLPHSNSGPSNTKYWRLQQTLENV